MAVASDGKHCAVPPTGYCENLFVNRRVLENCGLRVPGPDYSREKFLADCKLVRRAGYTPIACSLYEIPHYWFEFAVLNNGTLAEHLTVPRLDAQGRLIRDAVAETNAHITGIVGAVQDMISGEAKGELFADIQKCATGQMSAEEAVEAAIRLNEEP